MSKTPPIEQDDAKVQRLARWLERAVLGNGQPLPIPEGGLADLLAQAIYAWQAGKVYSPQTDRWVDRETLAAHVDPLDIVVEQLDDRAVRITHTPTGLSALDVTTDRALEQLTRHVKEAADAE